jgi:hypothetical protein
VLDKLVFTYIDGFEIKRDNLFDLTKQHHMKQLNSLIGVESCWNFKDDIPRANIEKAISYVFENYNEFVTYFHLKTEKDKPKITSFKFWYNKLISIYEKYGDVEITTSSQQTYKNHKIEFFSMKLNRVNKIDFINPFTYKDNSAIISMIKKIEEMKDCDVIETQQNNNCDITNQQQIIKKNKPNLTIIIPDDYNCDEKKDYKKCFYSNDCIFDNDDMFDDEYEFEEIDMPKNPFRQDSYLDFLEKKSKVVM